MDHLILLVNPTAGGGRARQVAVQVLDRLQADDWRTEVVLTRSAAHAVDVVAARASDEVVAVLSGDGLLGRAAAGAVESGCLIAPLPGGRGNDFVRALGLPRDPVQVAGRLRRATERRVDVGMCDGTAFLGVATVGFDSAANQYANAAKFIRGPVVYAYGAVRAFFGYRRPTLSLELDGKQRDFDGWSISIGNSGRYGGGMRICPHALLDDGLLDVVTMERLARREFVSMLSQVFKGTHTDHPLVTEQRAALVRVDGPADLAVFADGDPISQLPCEVTVRQGALRVLA